MLFYILQMFPLLSVICFLVLSMMVGNGSRDAADIVSSGVAVGGTVVFWW